MGNKASKQKKARSKTLAYEIPGLLPIEKLKSFDYDIKNLVFTGGGAKDFSYPGAVKVLEMLGILQKVKRFTGVGTGAIVAALLALGFDCSAMQYFYNQLCDYLQIDSYVGFNNIFPENTSSFGWNSGTIFLYKFGRILERRSYESDLTFMQLYKRSGKELCIVLTNVGKVCTEYCHPKTTPNLPICDAVFMSLTVPGIHCLKTVKGNDNVFVNGGLLCSYPVHCFDGWWLSMKPEDSLLNRLEVPSQYHNHNNVFEKRNFKTLGFVLIDKYTENNYGFLTARLIKARAQASIPNTCLGKLYKEALQKRDILEGRLIQLRQIAINLCKNTNDGNNDENMICENTLATNYLNDSPRPSGTYFPLVDESFENSVAYLKLLDRKDVQECAEWLEHVLKKRILSMLEEISNFYLIPINYLHSYFGAVFDIQHQTSMTLEEADFNRTIGIDSGHVVGNNELADDDKLFLYRQGWNSTVAYLKQTLLPSNDK